MKDSNFELIYVLSSMLWGLICADSIKREAIEKGLAEHDAKTSKWQWKEAK